MAEAYKAADLSQRRYSHACLAGTFARLGKRAEARQHFMVATKLEDAPHLYSVRGIREAEFKRASGDREGAADQTRQNREIATRHQWTDTQALCDTVLGLLSLPDEPAVARQHLDGARVYASRSGHVEVQLRCYFLAAEIGQTEGAFDLARSEAEAGIHLADTCDFGHYSIELRLTLARAHLGAGDAKAALQRAREALDRSVHPECQYAWGESDGLHLCGVAHARLGEVALARQRLSVALAKREQLTHPGLSETQAELGRLNG
jgi:hypothetical protein